MNSDFLDILRLLNAENAEYLVIGGYAVMKYSEPRFTKDLDILVNPTEKNSKKVYRALKKFGAPLDGISSKFFTKQDSFYKIGREPVRIDIVMKIDKVNFTRAWKRRVDSTIDDVIVRFISLEDLLANKRAAGRPQDLLDVEKLERVR